MNAYVPKTEKWVHINRLMYPVPGFWVHIYDAKTRKEVKRLKAGRGCAGILMDPDGTRAFVACTPDNYIAIIDLKTLEPGNHIEVGGNPDGLAWAVQP